MTIKVESFREAEAIGNLIAKVSELEEENAKLKSAVAWQKETIAARDATIGMLSNAFDKIIVEITSKSEFITDTVNSDGFQGWKESQKWRNRGYGEAMLELRALVKSEYRAALEPTRTEAEIVGKEDD